MDRKTTILVKEKLKKHYHNKQTIKTLKQEITNLEIYKSKIEIDIQESNITLESDIKGISYTEVKVLRSNNVSVQERAVDMAINKLEKKIEGLELEIKSKKYILEELKIRVDSFDNVINKLPLELKTIIIQSYENNKKSLEIGYELNVEDSTIRKKRKKALEIIYNGYYCYGEEHISNT